MITRIADERPSRPVRPPEVIRLVVRPDEAFFSLSGAHPLREFRLAFKQLEEVSLDVLPERVKALRGAARADAHHVVVGGENEDATIIKWMKLSPSRFDTAEVAVIGERQ